MFRRRENRKRRSLRDRLRDWFESAVGFVRRTGPYVVLLAVAVAIPYLVLTGYRQVVSSPYFEVSDIDIRGAAQADVHQLAEEAQLVHGTNIFDVEPSAASTVFEASPWVREARIDRQLPGTVVVELDEHRPAALLVDSGMVVVSEKGRAIETIESGVPNQFLGLPIITGLSADDLADDQAQTLMSEALRVDRLYEELGLSEAHPLSEIHVDPVVGLTMTVERPATEIRLGRGDYKKRLERLKTLRRSLDQRDIEPAYILLDQEDSLNRVTVGRR